MKHIGKAPLLAILMVSMGLASFALGCGSAAPAENTDEQQEVAVEEVVAAPTDGTYDIEVETDSSMFHADSCTLTVADGSYMATLVLPGEGFSRLYFGTAEEAASASDEDIYDYHLNDEGKYTFDIPVEALDEELQIAAFGQRRDTWYDHTIIFHAPEGDALADAA